MADVGSCQVVRQKNGRSPTLRFMAKVTMEIPSIRTGMFAQFFEEEGLDVSWWGPVEKSAGGGSDELVQIVYFLKANAAGGVIGGASYGLAQGAVRKLRARFPAIEVELEDDGADEELDI
jgi:hypothetical protein